MKQHENDTPPVEIIGDAETPTVERKTFTIAANAHAFSVLSAGLYSNRIRAIIRELAANAADSHVCAATTERFDIELPTPLSPFFVCRDYGTGMSESQVMGLYTTYFASTKGDTNTQVGQFGLGSKSPFAYCSGFTVESRHDGIKTTYSMFISEDGSPDVIKANQTEFSDGDHNGVTIILPVKEQDYASFSREAEQVFSYFPEEEYPNVTGGVNFTQTNVKYFIRDTTFGLRSYTRSDSECAYVVMGRIPYPINVDAIRSGFGGDPEALSFIEAYQNVAIDLMVPIGLVQVAPSREALSYDKKTCQNLVEFMRKVVYDIANSGENQLSSAPTRMDALRVYRETMNRDSFMGWIARKLSSGDSVTEKPKAISWRGIPAARLHSVEIQQTDSIPNGGYIHTAVVKEDSYRKNKIISQSVRTDWKGLAQTGGTVHIPNKVAVVINDIPGITSTQLLRGLAKSAKCHRPRYSHDIKFSVDDNTSIDFTSVMVIGVDPSVKTPASIDSVVTAFDQYFGFVGASCTVRASDLVNYAKDIDFATVARQKVSRAGYRILRVPRMSPRSTLTNILTAMQGDLTGDTVRKVIDASKGGFYIPRKRVTTKGYSTDHVKKFPELANNFMTFSFPNSTKHRIGVAISDMMDAVYNANPEMNRGFFIVSESEEKKLMESGGEWIHLHDLLVDFVIKYFNDFRYALHLEGLIDYGESLIVDRISKRCGPRTIRLTKDRNISLVLSTANSLDICAKADKITHGGDDPVSQLYTKINFVRDTLGVTHDSWQCSYWYFQLFGLSVDSVSADITSGGNIVIDPDVSARYLFRNRAFTLNHVNETIIRTIGKSIGCDLDAELKEIKAMCEQAGTEVISILENTIQDLATDIINYFPMLLLCADDDFSLMKYQGIDADEKIITAICNEVLYYVNAGIERKRIAELKAANG